RLGGGIGVGLVLQRQRETIFGVSLGHHANLVAQLSSVEIQHELAGDGLEMRAIVIDDDVAAVRKNAQLGKRFIDLRQLLIESREREAKPVRGNSAGDQLLCGPQADQVAKVVKRVVAALAWRHEAKLLPIGELLVRKFEETKKFASRESFRCAH